MVIYGKDQTYEFDFVSTATQGELAVRLYMWVNILLPMLSGKQSYNPQSRDLILQLVER